MKNEPNGEHPVENGYIPENDSANSYVRILYDLLTTYNVKEIVLSPGSRNAPLLIGASARPDLSKYIVSDERNAAFIALGISLVKQRPVALACTSGTALYNYAPAIAEAYYQHVPLIVITADRPVQWIGQDDSQTLVQPGALREITKGFWNIPVETEDCEELRWYVNRVVNEAIITSAEGIPGPVHINIQLDNPLGEKFSGCPTKNCRVVEYISNDSRLSSIQKKRLAADLKGKKILIVAGFMPPSAKLNQALMKFCNLPGVVLMAETISNVHLGYDCYCIDTMLSQLWTLSDSEQEFLKPQIVISIGGSLVSRMLKDFIRRCEGAEHWTLSDTSVGADCFKKLTRHIDSTPERFFKMMSSELSRIRPEDCWHEANEYRKKWETFRKGCLERRVSFVNDSGWSELRAFDIITRLLPRDCNLFLSNGTPIRYAQLFSDRVPHACYCNRGVSGIEGGNATAAGVAVAYKGETVLITGDMSFGYATNILGLPFLPDSFKIIVINNRGGGIFRFISTTRDLPEREVYFCTDPKVPVEGLAAAYGWEYFKASNEDELLQATERMFSCDKRSLLEIIVDPDRSTRLLREFLS